MTGTGALPHARMRPQAETRATAPLELPPLASPLLPQARANVAARLRASAVGSPDAARMVACADAIERGESGGWAIVHEVRRLEAQGA